MDNSLPSRFLNYYESQTHKINKMTPRQTRLNLLKKSFKESNLGTTWKKQFGVGASNNNLPIPKTDTHTHAHILAL